MRCHEITFDYLRYAGTREKAVRIRPFTLALYEHQFYVIGRRPEGELYPYRLARMSNVRTMKAFSYPPAGEYDPATVFSHAFGIIIGNQDEPVERVRLRFAPSWSAFISSHRWHVSQVAQPPADDGSVTVTLDVRCCHELTRWITGFGPDVEVLGPPSLRREVAARLRDAAAVYKRSAPRRPGPQTAKTAPTQRRATRRR